MTLPQHFRLNIAVIFSLLILIVCLSITYQVVNIVKVDVEQKTQDYFDFRVREAVDLIGHRMQAYKQVLRGAAGLFSALNNLGRAEFKQYVASLDLVNNFSGIQGVGFSLIVPSAKKTQHVASMHSDGFPRYTIRPEGQRKTYSSVIYLEPFSGRNLRAFGYDMLTEPERHATMQKAINTGQPSLSGKVRLLQETGKEEQAGFLMYLPIYRNGTKNSNLSERREHIIGWVYAPFRMDDLMAGLFGEHANDLDIKIFDGEDMSDNALMYASKRTSINPTKFHSTQRIHIADHIWTVHIHPLALMSSRVDFSHVKLVAVIGTAISILLSLLIWFLVTGRERAINAAKRMNSDLITQSQRLNSIIEGTRVGTWEWNVQTGEVFLNDYWTEIIGYKPNKLEPIAIETWVKLMYPEDGKLSGELLKKHFSGELDYYECEARMQHKDGHWVWVLDRGKVTVWTEDGKPLKMAGTHQDISKRKEAENELKIAASAFESQEGMFVTDVNSVILRINHSFTRITGYSESDAIGQTPRLLKSGRQSKEFYATLWNSIHDTGGWEGEILNRCKSGEVYPQQVTITAVKDSAGVILNYVATLTDITERKRLELELTKQAHLDYLTGLSNRRHFMMQGEVELSRAVRYDTPLSLMMLDIDFFKNVNDTYGHQVGDTVLQALSKICQDTLRQVDVVGRLGGEEFAVILPETASKEALEVAERLREAVADMEVMIPVGLPIHFTVSIGVTSLDNKDANIDMLLNQADKALYEAKETGRNKVCVD